MRPEEIVATLPFHPTKEQLTRWRREFNAMRRAHENETDERLIELILQGQSEIPALRRMAMLSIALECADHHKAEIPVYAARELGLMQ